MWLCFIECILHKYKGREDEKKRRRRLLDDLTETRKYCNLKEEALDRTVRRTRLEEDVDPSKETLRDDETLWRPSESISAQILVDPQYSTRTARDFTSESY